MTAYVVLKLMYANSDDLSLGIDPHRSFPRLPTPPFVFHNQSEAIDRASTLAAELPSHQVGTVEFLVLEAQQSFRGLADVPAPAPTPKDAVAVDNDLANALMLALSKDD